MTEFKIKLVKEVLITDLFQDELENFLYICRIGSILNSVIVFSLIYQVQHVLLLLCIQDF